MAGAAATLFSNPNLGTGVSDIFGAIGDFQAASGYAKAAQIDTENVGLQKEATTVQEFQTSRAVDLALGSEAATTGAAGLAAGGTNLNLLRSSMAQGSLAKQQAQIQGQINENTFAEEAAAHQAQANAANTAGIGGILGGVLGLFGI